MFRFPRRLVVLFLVSALASLPAWAGTATLNIYALAHSYNAGAGAGLDTGIDLMAGDRLTINVDPLDAWSAGSECRTSNAGGLTAGNPYGCIYPYYTSAHGSFPFGALVGRIGSGSFFLVGTAYDETVTNSGRLYLYYWDSYTHDNSGFITATVTFTSDSDGDGIDDADDACPGTGAGDLVDTNGCSIEDLCPCNNDWRNHGAYVSCVDYATHDFVKKDLISNRERGSIVSAAARSSCGQ
jgi:hypothetical protein